MIDDQTGMQMGATTSRQSGFTLIELLVVMIIIAILMAVAVPAYLGQKNKAQASQAKQNLKHVSDTIQSCAGSLTNGYYREGAVDCRDQAQIVANEASLAPLFANGYTVTRLGGATGGYDVRTTVTLGGVAVTFWIRSSTAGTLTKGCTRNRRVCPSRRW